MIGVSGSLPTPTVGTRGRTGCLHHTGHGRQRFNALMLKDISRGHEQPRFTRFGHQLHRADAVTPKRKKLTLNTNPYYTEDLGKECTENLFLGVRGARQRRLVAPNSGAGSALRSSLPLGFRGRASSTHDCRRHHVIGQAWARGGRAG